MGRQEAGRALLAKGSRDGYFFSETLEAQSVGHVIRLRGPWQCDVRAGQASDASTSVVIQVPCDLAQTFEPGFQGTVRLSRRFNRPTGLQAGERVWLALEDQFDVVKIVLNGQPIRQSAPPTDSIKVEITDWLLPHNLLVVDVAVEQGWKSRFNGARLEIDACSDG